MYPSTSSPRPSPSSSPYSTSHSSTSFPTLRLSVARLTTSETMLLRLSFTSCQLEYSPFSLFTVCVSSTTSTGAEEGRLLESAGGWRISLVRYSIVLMNLRRRSV
jgi:hypothetical protein